MSEDTRIVFLAQIVKVQTLVDGGLRVTLDLPETAILAAAHLMECKRRGVVGNVAFEPIESEQEQDDDSTISRRKAKQRIKQGNPGL